jgi:hypothetical protein
LTADEVSAWEASLQKPQIPTEVRASFVRHWVEDELLVQAARERGLADDPWVQGRIDELSRKLLSARLMELESSALVAPSKKEIERYFEAHKTEFVWPQLYLSMKYWRAPNRIPLDRLRATLINARPTPVQPAEIAKVDTGAFEIDDPASVDNAAWKLFGWMAEGQLGYPVPYKNSSWMFKVVRRGEPNSPQTLDDVRDVITARLVEESRLRRQTELISNLISEFRRSGRLEWPQASESPTPGDTTSHANSSKSLN